MIRQRGSETAEHDGKKNREHHTVAEGQISPLCVAPAQPDGGDSDAADGGEHKQSVAQHDEWKHYVDGAQGIGADALTDENTVDDGKEEKAHLTEDGGQNILN